VLKSQKGFKYAKKGATKRISKNVLFQATFLNLGKKKLLAIKEIQDGGANL
jgi:hypothetical protein